MDRNVSSLKLGLSSIVTFPARGTWIEIYMIEHNLLLCDDVPCKGNVDRNLYPRGLRNAQRDVPLKGNVDRNCSLSECVVQALLTFPARGTWIEILVEMVHGL